ncbi:class I SAM-dependent methyltransferase [Bacillus sp. THAF10]|uniref:class I SAM-dependent methyltransferase n=1 Tax=Bacillus sp. THAF10 TaxID=2587848 RepID=UPI001C12A98A|nr:SAM-dependent methyltransferase [Bacillus sp. THAF10]
MLEKIHHTPTRKIDYAEYMITVLYHPIEGYYMKEKEKVGGKGDFLTTSNVHTIFGKVFAKLFVQYIVDTGLDPFFIEIGGGNGRFAKQFLEEVEILDKEIYKRMSYVMVETSPYHIQLQRHHIPNSAPIIYTSGLEDVPKHARKGIVFSNELFDALPVHVIEYTDEGLKEVFVSVDESGKLTEIKSPLENDDILAYLSEYNVELTEGQRMEIPLAMKMYAEILGQWLEAGTIITVDYGYRFQELTNQELKNGSLRGYYHHSMIANPLRYPSEMDLTSHIHLDALEECFIKSSFSHVCTMRQGEFLIAAGILDYLQENQDSNPFSEKSKQNRAIRSLIMDSSWSNSFCVMLHEKGTDGWKTIKSD